MRRLFIVGLAFAAQACTITIPAGVLGKVTETPAPTSAACASQFVLYDKDKSGSLSQAEFSAYFATLPMTAIACLDPADPSKTITCPQHDPVLQFGRYDFNGDGKLSSSEFCAGPTVPLPSATPIKGPPPAVPSECELRFQRADADNNGRITLEEWSAADYREPPPPGMARAAVMPSAEDQKADFQRRDRNQDGTLDRAELCDAPNPQPTLLGTPVPAPSPVPDGCIQDFKAFDTNQDGALSYAEYAEGKYGKLRFFRAPTPQEVEASKAGFRDEARKLDTNQDQKLSQAEFASSCQ
ncbi:MAG: Calcium-binding EF-hand-containing protein [Cyanobacteria bacterium RYN_339]|nr:Calcium-binding EF-hand-containing protein [Cyanobacteria bacterium RYN_339]